MASRNDVDRPSFRQRRVLYVGSVAVGALALIAVGMSGLTTRDPTPPQSVSVAGPSLASPPGVEVLPPPTFETPKAQAPISESLADAFEAATGHRASYSVIEDGDTFVIRPLRTIDLPFGRALLTEQDSDDACHACVGAIGVYYLREKAGKLEVTGRWPRAVEGWGWGHPPTEWSTTDQFTSYPAIYATGGYLATGVMTGGATITELRPAGPATSDIIGTDYDDEGVVEAGERPCVVESRIANIRKDRSFDVVVTGSVRAVDRYVKRKGRFVAVKRIRWDMPCGISDAS